jgi:hypothetical protein
VVAVSFEELLYSESIDLRFMMPPSRHGSLSHTSQISLSRKVGTGTTARSSSILRVWEMHCWLYMAKDKMVSDTCVSSKQDF